MFKFTKKKVFFFLIKYLPTMPTQPLEVISFFLTQVQRGRYKNLYVEKKKRKENDKAVLSQRFKKRKLLSVDDN